MELGSAAVLTVVGFALLALGIGTGTVIAMNKAHLRDMRAILASEANRSGFPKLAAPAIAELERYGYIAKVGDTYKSTQQGRAVVLAAPKSK